MRGVFKTNPNLLEDFEITDGPEAGTKRITCPETLVSMVVLEEVVAQGASPVVQFLITQILLDRAIN